MHWRVVEPICDDDDCSHNPPRLGLGEYGVWFWRIFLSNLRFDALRAQPLHINAIQVDPHSSVEGPHYHLTLADGVRQVP